MSVLDFGTHAELEQRLYTDPSACGGQMVVVDHEGPIWEIECERCRRFRVGVPARQIDPATHNAQLVERRREDSQIPATLRGLSLPDDGSELSRAVTGWATGKAELQGLTLTGDVGTGKTYYAAAAAWRRMELGPLRWFSVPDLFAQLERAFNDDRRVDALDVLSGNEALVLDDLDKARPTEYGCEKLFWVIDAHVTAGAALLVTTNLAPSRLAERYGQAIVSRLVGCCKVCPLRGPDRRLERFAA